MIASAELEMYECLQSIDNQVAAVSLGISALLLVIALDPGSVRTLSLRGWVETLSRPRKKRSSSSNLPAISAVPRHGVA